VRANSKRIKMRDEFPDDVKRKLAGRAGNVCSNPNCGQPTSGPSEAAKAVTNVGVAAHITAASVGGPRYNPSLTQEERSDFDNVVWLCQKCSKAVDDDPITYTEKVLRDWKSGAEESARKAIEEGPRLQQPPIDVRVLIHKAYFLNSPIQHFFIKIINATRDADVEITHVWYENETRTVEILSARLPRRLKPSETYETWVPVSDIPESEDCFQHFRVVVSTGEVYTSQQNQNVRPYGFVAGR
jgi:hypothetical protein